MMDNKSRMSREAQVRFCEKLGLKCPCLLDCCSRNPFGAADAGVITCISYS
jgi:hypothetical protein